MKILISTNEEYYHELRRPNLKFVRMILLAIADNCPGLKLNPQHLKVRNLVESDVLILAAEIDDHLTSTGHIGVIQQEADDIVCLVLPVELM